MPTQELDDIQLAYLEGFVQKCAAVGVDPEAVLKRAQAAGPDPHATSIGPQPGPSRMQNLLTPSLSSGGAPDVAMRGTGVNHRDTGWKTHRGEVQRQSRIDPQTSHPSAAQPHATRSIPTPMGPTRMFNGPTQVPDRAQQAVNLGIAGPAPAGQPPDLQSGRHAALQMYDRARRTMTPSQALSPRAGIQTQSPGGPQAPLWNQTPIGQHSDWIREQINRGNIQANTRRPGMGAGTA